MLETPGPRPERRPSTGLAPALALLATIVGAGAPSPGTAQEVSETIEVRVVNVDVYVTDKKGRPVEGLAREDFVLRVDGEITPISNFWVTAGGVLPPSPPQSPGSTQSPQAIDSATLASNDPLHAVLYIDSYAVSPPDRARILDDLESFAATQVKQGVRFMLVNHASGLHVLTSFTDSTEEIRRALAATSERPAQGFNSLIAHRRALEDIELTYKTAEDSCPQPHPCDCAWHQMLIIRDLYSAEITGRQSRSRDALAEVTRSLAGLEGRKALFYVSSGLEQYPGVDLVRYMSEVCPKYEREFMQTLWRWDDTSALEELAADANANRVTLYALDAGGLRASGAADVSSAEIAFRPSPRASEVRRRNLEASLFLMADRTGGQAIFNANAPAEALEDAASDFGNYYSLGFQPSGPAGGEKHQIEVELSKGSRAAQLRFRRSYRDKPAHERQIERTLTALHWEHGDNPLGATLAVGTILETGKKRYEVPVEIRLAEADLTRIPGQPARIHLTLAAHDLREGRTDLREKSVELPVPGHGENGHVLSIEIELAPGEYRFAAGIRDEISGVASYLGSSYSLAPTAAER